MTATILIYKSNIYKNVINMKSSQSKKNDFLIDDFPKFYNI